MFGMTVKHLGNGDLVNAKSYQTNDYLSARLLRSCK